MALLSFLFPQKQKSATAAKERLQIIIARERTDRAGPDFLPALHRELIEVISTSCCRTPEPAAHAARNAARNARTAASACCRRFFHLMPITCAPL
jgi:hypothetical protein